jgi:hypothetical protein
MKIAIQGLVVAVMLLSWTASNSGLAGGGEGSRAPIAKTAAESAQTMPASSGPWSATGKRDPFVSLISARETAAPCRGGKQCLEVGQITLKGIIRSPNGLIAVVTNAGNRAYFLHENDAIGNAVVLAIGANSVDISRIV